MKTIYSRIDIIQYVGNDHYKVMVYPVTGKPFVSRFTWHKSAINRYGCNGVKITASYKK